MITHILMYTGAKDNRLHYEHCTSVEQARLVEAEYRRMNVLKNSAFIFEHVESIHAN